MSWSFLLWILDFRPGVSCKASIFTFIYSSDVEVKILWDEVCGLSFWGRKEEEVLGSFPDSLEPCCNSLIETEWDVLITLVVKTEGGEDGREGRMCALISQLREAEMGGGPPINTAKLCSEESQDFTSSKLLKPFGTQLLCSYRTDTFLQPWEDIFLLSGWHRAASLQGRTRFLEPPPVGHIQRVYLVFTAGRNPKLDPKQTGIRAWNL